MGNTLCNFHKVTGHANIFFPGRVFVHLIAELTNKQLVIFLYHWPPNSILSLFQCLTSTFFVPEERNNDQFLNLILESQNSERCDVILPINFLANTYVG